jgi:predicted aspartyl protease/Flp pilus assembly protein TadD
MTRPVLKASIIQCAVLLFCFQAAASELSEARQLYLKGDFSAAIKKYKSIIETNPQSEESHLSLIRSFLKLEAVYEANESAEKGLKLFPVSASIHAAFGDVLFRIGKMPEARDAYLKTIKIDPKNARGYFGLAQWCSFNFSRKSTRSMRLKAYEFDSKDPDIVFDYANELTGVDRILILQRYLQLAANEPKERKVAAEDDIAYLKKMGDAKTWLLTDPPKKAEIPLDPIRSSPSSEPKGWQVIVFINGRKTTLQLDTGARNILLTPGKARNLELETISPVHIEGLGNLGAQSGKTALAKTVKIGPLEFKNCPVTVSDRKLTFNADGIMGIDIFQSYLVALNFPQNKMELKSLPPIEGKTYGDPLSWKELDRTIPPELASFALMGWRGHITIPTIVNNKKAGFFILDSGSGRNIVNQDFAASITGMGDAFPVVVLGLSGAIQASIVKDASLSIGRFKQDNSDLLMLDLNDMSHHAGFEISGLIGYPLLKHLVIIIDFRDGLIDFQYPAGDVAEKK